MILSKKPSRKTKKKEIAFRDMIERLHCITEDINMKQAQSPTRSHSDKLKATRIVRDNGESHIFANDDMTVRLEIHMNKQPY